MKPVTALLTLSVSCFNLHLFAAEKQGFERLVVQRSNGSGIQETYEITPDGKFKFSDVKGANAKGQLEGDDLKSFVATVNAVEWVKLPKSKAAQGDARFKADLFQYSVAIVEDKKFYNLSFHESAYPDDEKMQAFISAIPKLKK